MNDDDDLTLDKLNAVLQEFRTKFPEPDAWVYGIEIQPLGGPLGLTFDQLARFMLCGWIEHEKDRFYWTPRAVNAIRHVISSGPQANSSR